MSGLRSVTGALRARSRLLGALGGILGAMAWLASTSVILFLLFGRASSAPSETTEMWADVSAVVFVVLGTSLVLIPVGLTGLRGPTGRIDGLLAVSIVLGLGVVAASVVVAVDRPTQCMGPCYRVLGRAGAYAVLGGLWLGGLANTMTGISFKTTSAPQKVDARMYRAVGTLFLVGGATAMLLLGGFLFFLAIGGTIVSAIANVAATILLLRHAESA